MTDRKELDFYETPGPLVEALLKECPWIGGRVLEPCAGDLAIARYFLEPMTNDIDPERQVESHLDATNPYSWPYFSITNWVVTNPPFSLAETILPFAYQHAKDGVAFLLRLSYMEPTKGRARWLKKHQKNLSNMIIFNPRPQFIKDKKSTDSVTVAWFVWEKWRTAEGLTKVTYVTDWK